MGLSGANLSKTRVWSVQPLSPFLPYCACFFCHLVLLQSAAAAMHAKHGDMPNDGPDIRPVVGAGLEQQCNLFNQRRRVRWITWYGVGGCGEVCSVIFKRSDKETKFEKQDAKCLRVLTCCRRLAACKWTYPDIDLFCQTLHWTQHFRRSVLWGSIAFYIDLDGLFRGTSRAEITQLVIVIRNEYILHLEISMHDAEAMHMSDGLMPFAW